MNKIERVDAVVSGQSPDRPPVSFWHHFGPDAVSGPEAVGAHLRHLETYDLDFLKVMDDNRYPRTFNRVGVLGGVEDLDRWYPTRTAEAGSWLARGSSRISASAVLVDTRSEPYLSGTRLVTDPVTYTDVALGGQHGTERLELEGRAGARLISRGALTVTGRGTRAFAAVDAAVWITPRLAIAGALGRQLSDLARGTPDTHFASLALRVALSDRSWTPPDARSRRARSQPAPAPTRPQLTLTSDSTAAARLVVTGAQHAQRVELAATFTGWEPVALIREGERWRLDRPVTSGTHRVLLRIDGGPWLVPANLPAAADDFGGSVGLLTVP
jgi:hypothetical protein